MIWRCKNCGKDNNDEYRENNYKLICFYCLKKYEIEGR